VRNGAGDGSNGQWGWGDHIACHFDTERIEVMNRALGGRSSRTFITNGEWDAALLLVEHVDFVLIQFGHNDSSPVNDDSRARGTLKGIGEETEEIDNLLTGLHETVHTFGWYLRNYVRDTHAKGAFPVLLSPVPYNRFDEYGHIRRNDNDYGEWTRQVAGIEGVPFIDLNKLAAAALDDIVAEHGRDMIDTGYFKDDDTHTSLAGAKLNAAMVIKGIKSLGDFPLKQYLIDSSGVKDRKF
jgi:lysophospholipase L1-like esterase